MPEPAHRGNRRIGDQGRKIGGRAEVEAKAEVKAKVER